MTMTTTNRKTMRVAFQGEPGAFSEAAAIQLLGESISTVPRPTFEGMFHAVPAGAADAILAPVENSLAGSVVRVFDLLLESRLAIVAETILPIEMQLIALPGASLKDIRSVASHPMALAQCERFFAAHPNWKRVPAEDTAGSVREAISAGDKSRAAIAGRRAAEHYRAVILAERIQDNTENFTRFVLLVEAEPGRDETCDTAKAGRFASPGVADLMVELRIRQMEQSVSPPALKMSLAMRLAHRPGSLLASLEPFARHGINLQKIESRPIHGHPWEYQFFIDVEANSTAQLDAALLDVSKATSFLRILGLYPAAQR